MDCTFHPLPDGIATRHTMVWRPIVAVKVTVFSCSTEMGLAAVSAPPSGVALSVPFPPALFGQAVIPNSATSAKPINKTVFSLCFISSLKIFFVLRGEPLKKTPTTPKKEKCGLFWADVLSAAGFSVRCFTGLPKLAAQSPLCGFWACP